MKPLASIRCAHSLGRILLMFWRSGHAGAGMRFRVVACVASALQVMLVTEVLMDVLALVLASRADASPGIRPDGVTSAYRTRSAGRMPQSCAGRRACSAIAACSEKIRKASRHFSPGAEPGSGFWKRHISSSQACTRGSAASAAAFAAGE